MAEATMTFVLSNRRAGRRTSDAQKRSAEAFDHSFGRVLSANVRLSTDAGAPTSEEARRVLHVEATPSEIAGKAAELHPDVIIEPLLRRQPLLYRGVSAKILSALAGPDPVPAGRGAEISFRVLVSDAPALETTVTVFLRAKVSRGKQETTSSAVTDDQGRASVAYDPLTWMPEIALFEPAAGAWSVVVHNPVNGQTVTLPPIAMRGPVGWWNALTGAASSNPDAGRGIRVGIVDTGVGPHPYLDHVTRIGSFIDGNHDADPNAAADVDRHGTHVAGIIAARPADDPTAFAGVAQAAEVFMARVFPPGGGGASQGDVASAIETLATDHQVDLINLSLGGSASQIEADAVQVAFEHGAACICAAGNESGSPVLFPAALPQCAAISALGLLGTIPPGALDYMDMPGTLDMWTTFGIFLTSFSNIGPEIDVAAGGNGIISTVPATAAFPKPYLALSGTSMSSPVAAGALAASLGRIEQYKASPRDEQRAWIARYVLAQTAWSIGLSPLYQGRGMARQLLARV